VLASLTPTTFFFCALFARRPPFSIQSIGYAVGLEGVGQLLRNMCTAGGAAFVFGGWSAFTCGSMVMFEIREIEKRADKIEAGVVEDVGESGKEEEEAKQK
jgi:hypothetical protein